jgi:hypothetical protein
VKLSTDRIVSLSALFEPGTERGAVGLSVDKLIPGRLD